MQTVHSSHSRGGLELPRLREAARPAAFTLAAMTKLGAARSLPVASIFVASLLAIGCVTQAKYKELQGALDDANTRLAAHSVESTKREEALAKMRDGEAQKAARLKDALAQAESEVAAHEREIATLRTTLADADRELKGLGAELEARDQELAAVLRKRAALKASLDRIGEALSDLTARKLMAERRVAEYRDMLGRFKALIDAGKLDVRIVDGRMVLTLPMDILFASGRTELSTAGKDSIAQVGVVLASIPDKQFMVEGHTDDVPIHTQRFASNWELSAGRAMVVVHALRKAGVADAQLAAGAFGEHHPRVANEDDAARALNRRIEIVVMPDLRGLPGYDELERLDAE